MHAIRLLSTRSASDNDPSSHREPTEEEQTVGSIVATVFGFIAVCLVLAVMFGPVLSPYDWRYGQLGAGYVVVETTPHKLKGSKTELPSLAPLRVPPPEEDKHDRTQATQPDAARPPPPTYEVPSGV